MNSVSKKTKLTVCIAILLIAYFGSAMAFRSYNSGPEDTTRTFDSEEEAVEALLSPFEKREQTLFDRVYAPAEAILRSVGL